MSADYDATVGPIISDTLELHGLDYESWCAIRSVNSPVANAVRYDVVVLLHAREWASSRIATSLGIDPSTVRRNVRRLLRSGAEDAIVHLPLASEPPGFEMVGRPGVRHDCVNDSECLRALLRKSPSHDPPRHASCPTVCTRMTLPNKDMQRYDAGRGSLWGTGR